MKNEQIKEILDKLKDSVDNPIIDVPTCDGSDSEPMDNTTLLEPNACKLLYDYITNLQQENEKLKYNARGQVNDYFKDKYADEVLKNAELTKENEFLKLNNPEQNMEHFRIVKENKRKIDNLRKENEKLKEELKNRPIVDFTFDVYKELEDYKSRRKKAIEYINKQKKKMYKSRNKIALFILMKLENILNRSDEDEY